MAPFTVAEDVPRTPPEQASTIRRSGGNISASSLHNMAASVNSPAPTGQRRIHASVAARENTQSSSVVRPLIQRSAMLIPWKLNIHIATAHSAEAEDNESRRASMKSNAASVA